MLLALGSNLSMMEQLTSYGRPLFGRTRELRLDPLTVADTAAVAGLDAADAIDAHLVVGGYPRVLSEWEPGATLHTFLEHQLSDSTSPLVVVGERIVTAEFPQTLQAVPYRVRSALVSGPSVVSRAGWTSTRDR